MQSMEFMSGFESLEDFSQFTVSVVLYLKFSFKLTFTSY